MTLSKTSASIAPRLAGIDLFRILAIFAVIVLHATPSLSTAAQPGQVDWSNLSHQAARFAVPFFFTVSGYFWATKALAPGGPVEPTIKMLKKLGSLFLAWSVFYSLVIDYRGAFDHGVTGPLKLIVWNLRSYAAHPLKLVLEGTQSHLWFLPALMCCVAISCAFLHFKFERLLIIGAALMYCVGLAGKAYSHTPLGFISDFNFRDGPFFGLIFFVSGYLLWARKVRAWRC